RILFDRQESGECTSRVVFPDFALNRALPAYATTAVEFMPSKAGRFGFACGMNMVHGTLLVEPDGSAGGNGHTEHALSVPASAGEEAGAPSVEQDIAHRTAEMNALITVGTTTAYAYSLFVTMLPGVFPADLRDLYFEAVGTIITLILIGRLLEARAKAGTGEAIRKLIVLQPRTARL